MTTDIKTPSHRRPAPFRQFYFGAAYYPEHWGPAERKEDAARMAAAGFNVVRMAEFAWDRLEPEEGKYDFAFFDEVIADLDAKGIRTILCTPTAAPPRWLTVKHPDILRVNAPGVPLQHGSRQHCCHSSRRFREYSQAITAALAAHYAGCASVVGWQTDNELLCHFAECHCHECERGFTEFLKQKYNDDIGLLNRTWGTAFWSQTYTDFDQIQTPKKDLPTFPNPAQQLDYYRYISRAVTEFQHDQVEILREAGPQWFIFHNGLFKHIDYRGRFTRDLDVLGFDCYPLFSPDPAVRHVGHAFNLDRARGWSGNVIIPEHQSGPGGQAPYFHDNPEPGELKRLTYVSLARAADSLLYFRWRTCRFGAEQYWCGILEHDNVPRRRYEEVKRIGAELKVVGPELVGTSVAVHAGIASCDQEVADAHETYSVGLPAPDTMARIVHGELYKRGYAVGCVHPSDDLSGLKLYIIPHWALFDPAWVPNLARFVTAGGILVIGARTATRDVHNNVVPQTPPGVLRELAGITVLEYGRQNRPDRRPLKLDVGGAVVQTGEWYEVLQTEGEAQSLADWQNRHLRHLMAVSTRPVGKGRVIYVGTYLTAAMCEELVPLLASASGLKPLWPHLPAGVEAVRRQSPEKSLWFFINHNGQPVTLSSVPQGLDLVTGREVNGSVELAAGDVLVIKVE